MRLHTHLPAPSLGGASRGRCAPRSSKAAQSRSTRWRSSRRSPRHAAHSSVASLGCLLPPMPPTPGASRQTSWLRSSMRAVPGHACAPGGPHAPSTPRTARAGRARRDAPAPRDAAQGRGGVEHLLHHATGDRGCADELGREGQAALAAAEDAARRGALPRLARCPSSPVPARLLPCLSASSSPWILSHRRFRLPRLAARLAAPPRARRRGAARAGAACGARDAPPAPRGGAAAAAPRPEPRAARAQGGARRRRHTSRARSRRSTVRGSCCQTSRRSTAGSRPRFGRSSRSRVAGGARRRAARRCSGPPSCEPHWRLPAGAARKAASAGRRSQHPSSPRRSLALPSPPLPPLWLSLPPPPPSLALPSPSFPLPGEQAAWRRARVCRAARLPRGAEPARVTTARGARRWGRTRSFTRSCSQTRRAGRPGSRRSVGCVPRAPRPRPGARDAPRAAGLLRGGRGRRVDQLQHAVL